MTINVLVVDDSAFMRKIIADQIKFLNGIEVCGIARSGDDALRVIPKYKPDVITLDIEMPGLNGLDTLKLIKKEFGIPVIMLSSHAGEDITIEALELGAMDFIEKPQNLVKIETDFADELGRKLNSIAESVSTPVSQKNQVKTTRQFPNRIKGIVIGASTGGPRALMNLIRQIPAELKIPIFVVQHMPAGFTQSFAKRLDQEAAVKVVEAADGMIITGGTVYLAPGDFHLRLIGNQIRLSREEKIHGVRPAVDYLFESAAQIYRQELVGIILTGMGNDGTDGMADIKETGGYTIAQDQASSVVFGMPRRAIEANVVNEVASLNEIGERLNWMIKVKQWT
ncbi:chemotaxis response regulator protein-glutamate methylesterase [uncultured Vagococcus sp.]|uniref:protein-glutamate methylesterase/protein-glutamine glutaminase n=1 Tax=uncultured Vagococcus sp. TaxID=189676 RepID=UPI0028D51664|nr:chemotaxis response regulator protein-glutamate methylesterase [uncultured Vagococcus sp.]